MSPLNSLFPNWAAFPTVGHPWLLFPVRLDVNPTPAPTALAAFDPALKRRYLDVIRVARFDQIREQRARYP